MNDETIAECMQLSFADTPFPIVMRKLASAGVVAYSTDLIALRKTYYDDGTGSTDEPLPLTDAPVTADAFDATAVRASLQAIQHQEIGYAEFLRRIMRGGCARYIVFFGGRKAIYFGRDGDFYTEPFPTSAQ
jgi:uncharacterized protein YbcV (DUF1398 family)